MAAAHTAATGRVPTPEGGVWSNAGGTNRFFSEKGYSVLLSFRLGLFMNTSDFFVLDRSQAGQRATRGRKRD